MKRTAHIHIPRVAGRSIDRWARSARRRVGFRYQRLYHPGNKGRYAVGAKWTPVFDPVVDWTYVGHSYVGD